MGDERTRNADRLSNVDRTRRGARCRHVGTTLAVRAVWTGAALLTCAGAIAQPAPSASSATRIVAVSDVHGAYDTFVGLLRAAKLVDDKVAWSGGGATLIVVGDTIDR